MLNSKNTPTKSILRQRIDYFKAERAVLKRQKNSPASKARIHWLTATIKRLLNWENSIK